VSDAFYLSFLIVSNTVGMVHLKIINNYVSVNIPVNITGWNTPNCRITFEMLSHCDVLPLCIMLWAVAHQLESLSNI